MIICLLFSRLVFLVYIIHTTNSYLHTQNIYMQCLKLISELLRVKFCSWKLLIFNIFEIVNATEILVYEGIYIL